MTEPTPKGGSNVIHLHSRRPKLAKCVKFAVESMSGKIASEHGFWIGGIADAGKVHVRLEISVLSPDATRVFAKTLLLLADSAEAQSADRTPDVD